MAVKTISMPTGARNPVQTALQASGSSTSRTATLGSAPTVGNVLFMITVAEAGGAVSSIAQTNVTWTQFAGSTAAVAPVIEIWKGVIAASPGTSAVVTFGSSEFHAVCLSEWSGLLGLLDGVATERHVTNDANGFHFIPPIQPNVDSSLILVGVSTTSNGTTFTNFVGPLAEIVSGITVGCYWGFPGGQAVYGAAKGGAAATSTGLAVSIV